MRIAQEELAHPTQASRVRLSVFEQVIGKDVPAADDSLRGLTGFLVTEERIGTSTVYATLGFYLDRDAAVARLHARAAELVAQRYQATATGSAPRVA